MELVAPLIVLILSQRHLHWWWHGEPGRPQFRIHQFWSRNNDKSTNVIFVLHELQLVSCHSHAHGNESAVNYT